MATLIPTFEQIAVQKVQPEEGELHLLHFLDSNLDSSFEIYYQPFLNGDRPDIVIIRKNYGIMIIEVKDWDLKKYKIDQEKKWRVKNDTMQSTYTIQSPINQVLKYKENIYTLHIPNLLEKHIKNYKYWAVVSCTVYFHNANFRNINELIIRPFDKEEKYIKFLNKNISFWGRDSLTKENLNNTLYKNYLLSHYKSHLFDDDIYNSLKRYLQPPYHTIEQGTGLKLTAFQQRLAQSEPKAQRVKGVMGSGKTTILAHRAVSALKRHDEKERILILTYNITLKNYIHDKISQVRDNFQWGRFYITNYHSFISDTMRKHDISFHIPTDFDSYSTEKKDNYFEKFYYSNLHLFDNIKLDKYKTILIDEIQDYKRPWMDMIKELFLAENGEYVIWGDEKQNIYGNELENKDIKVNVLGRPIELKECFRSDEKIRRFAIDFQKHLLAHKYNTDNFDTHGQLSLDFSGATSDYINYIFAPAGDSILALFNIVMGNIESLGCHPNDIAVLSSSIPFLRNFDCYYRYKTREKTTTMFETQEIWYNIMLDEITRSSGFTQQVLNSRLRNTPIKDRKNSSDLIFKHLSTLITIYELYNKTQEDNIFQIMVEKLEKYEISSEKFIHFYNTDFKEYYLIPAQPNHKKFDARIEKIRENKKYNFWNNTGTIKFSTIHSFKGWEAGTLFLIIHKGEEHLYNTTFNELIYTGLTRSKHNLIIINFGNIDYHKKLESITSTITKHT